MLGRRRVLYLFLRVNDVLLPWRFFYFVLSLFFWYRFFVILFLSCPWNHLIHSIKIEYLVDLVLFNLLWIVVELYLYFLILA